MASYYKDIPPGPHRVELLHRELQRLAKKISDQKYVDPASGPPESTLSPYSIFIVVLLLLVVHALRTFWKTPEDADTIRKRRVQTIGNGRRKVFQAPSRPSQTGVEQNIALDDCRTDNNSRGVRRRTKQEQSSKPITKIVSRFLPRDTSSAAPPPTEEPVLTCQPVGPNPETPKSAVEEEIMRLLETFI